MQKGKWSNLSFVLLLLVIAVTLVLRRRIPWTALGLLLAYQG